MSESEMRWAMAGFVAGRASANANNRWPKGAYTKQVEGRKGQEILDALTDKPITINELLATLHPTDPTPAKRDYIGKILAQALAAGAIEFVGNRPRRFFKQGANK